MDLRFPNGTSKSEHDPNASFGKQANGTSHHEHKQQKDKVHPLWRLFRDACLYAKDNKLMAFSIALAIASEGYFQVYTEDQTEVGIGKSNVILARAVHSRALDLSATFPLIMAKTIAGFTTGCNIANDFLFLRPQEFIEGYEKAFPEGFFKGIRSKNKYTLSSMLSLIANIGAFGALTYADVMTFDNPDSKGGNGAGMISLMALIMYGGVFNYFMTQGADTHDGLEFTFANEDKSFKSAWHYLKNAAAYTFSCGFFGSSNGLGSTAFETELVRKSQDVIRGVLGGFLVKQFFENRGFLGSSYTMKIVPPVFGFLTAMQSFLARDQTGYKRNFGPLKVGKDSKGEDIIYRFDQIEAKALQNQYLKDYQDISCRFWKKYKRLVNPVCFAQTGLFTYSTWRLTQALLSLLPESMNGVGTDYVGPGILGFAAALLSIKTYYRADMRKELSRRIQEDVHGKPEETSSSKLAEVLSKIIVAGAFTARTINGVPAMISFGEYLPFLSDLDKTVLAYTLGTLVNVAGYEYYYPNVCKSTQGVIDFLKECFTESRCCRKVSDDPNTMFGKYHPSINSEFMVSAKEPLLGNSNNSDEVIDYSVSSPRSLTTAERIV